MDTAEIIIVVLCGLLAGIVLSAIAVLIVARRTLASFKAPPPSALPVEALDALDSGKKVSLTVAHESDRVCATCRHWDLEAGQNEMKRNPAFQQATEHLLPWQMAHPRQVKPNPAYIALEEKMQAAVKAEDHDEARKLHHELLRTDPGEVIDPSEYVPPEVLKLTWSDVGACAKHQELRMRTDKCEAYEMKLQAVS